MHRASSTVSEPSPVIFQGRCCFSVILNSQRFRTFTPFQTPGMLLFHLLGPSIPRLRRFREQAAVLSSHGWSDSRTRRAPIVHRKAPLSASINPYISFGRCLCSRLKAALFLLIGSDHGCIGSPLRYQEQLILPN